jgi:hypothetical protein
MFCLGGLRNDDFTRYGGISIGIFMGQPSRYGVPVTGITDGKIWRVKKWSEWGQGEKLRQKCRIECPKRRAVSLQL